MNTTISKWRTLFILAGAELLAMSLWFSATAVLPALRVEWALTDGQAAWLTMTVQIGFVVGALVSAVFNVSDLWPPRTVFALGALAGAVANGLIVLTDTLFIVFALRFLTGVSLAAVYPVGMKIMATWTKEDRGLGLGLLVGALTIGSASPHLIRGLGQVESWHGVILTASVAATIGGLLVRQFGHLGPYRSKVPVFRWRYLATAFTNRSLRLANLGYLGHMWELYAMWTWIPAFLAYTFAQHGGWGASDPTRTAAFITFFVIAAGGLGSLLAGLLADRWGRTRTTILSMATSGTCALIIGLFVHTSPTIVTAIALIWGFAIVADSAQFSTAVSELGDPDYMGTLLTTQTSMGFLLTMVTIRMMPSVVDAITWTWAFAVLALGPLVGCTAMWLLKRSPDAHRLAGGNG